MHAPDPRQLRRSQADFPLIGLSEFGRPPLQEAVQCERLDARTKRHLRRAQQTAANAMRLLSDPPSNASFAAASVVAPAANSAVDTASKSIEHA
jgi:hypothetical protein